MRRQIMFLMVILSMMFCTKVFAYKEYDIGDKITYRNETYYVVDYSDAKTDYVKLLKDKPLTVDELQKYGSDSDGNLIINSNINYYVSDPEKKIYEYDNGIGGMAFYSTEGCGKKQVIITGSPRFESDLSNCSSDFNTSDIKKVLNNWIKDFEDDLISVDGEKFTLLSINDLIENFNYESTYDISDVKYYNNFDIYDWLYNKDYNTWLINDLDDSVATYNINRKGDVYKINVIEAGAVRPIIFLSKCSLGENNCNCVVKQQQLSQHKVTKYKAYDANKEVFYKGEKYYTIGKSSSKRNYVTLLKDEPLTIEEIKKYDQSNTYNDSIGMIRYFSDSVCSSCFFEFDVSNIKTVIDSWISNELNSDDFVDVDGLKGRILTASQYNYFNNDTTKKFVVQSDYDYWIDNPHTSNGSIDYKAIRPVIYLKKSLFNNSNYNIGDIVSYGNDNYYVIEESGADKNYLVLFKQEPLTKKQILEATISYGVMPYYKSDTCQNGDNNSGCSSNYDQSLVKNTLDSWATDKSIMEDLVEVNNYKIRLLTKDELIMRLGYGYHSIITQYSFDVTEDVPLWMYNRGYNYWTMSSEDDNGLSVYVILNSGIVDLAAQFLIDDENKYVYNDNAVRPVINLNKCALDGGCYEVDEDIINNVCLNEENSVNVENTLKIFSKILLFISIILIIGGFIILCYNYILLKRNRK